MGYGIVHGFGQWGINIRRVKIRTFSTRKEHYLSTQWSSLARCRLAQNTRLNISLAEEYIRHERKQDQPIKNMNFYRLHMRHICSARTKRCNACLRRSSNKKDPSSEDQTPVNQTGHRSNQYCRASGIDCV
jgi:hypothetical protein